MSWKDRIRQAFEAARITTDESVIDELDEHLESVAEACRAGGADDAQLLCEVDREIGAWVRDPPRHARSRPAAPSSGPPRAGAISGLSRDVRYAFRLIRREPGPTLVAASTTALAIAALTVMSAVVWGVLLEPLPWPDADRVVRIYEGRRGGNSQFGQFGRVVTNATYLAWRDKTTTMAGLAAWHGGEVTLSGLGRAERIQRARVTPSLFEVLEVAPVLGRVLLPEDARDGAAPVALISYGFWRDRLGSRSDAVGRPVRLDRVTYTIVGVMGPGFVFPHRETQLWVPMNVRPVIDPQSHDGHIDMFSVIGRLKPGATPAQAAAEAEAHAEAAPASRVVAMAVFGSDGPSEVLVEPALVAATGTVRPALLILLAAVGLLLVAACGNVANVQLARAVARRRELAIRGALGARAADLFRQLVVDSILTGLIGGATGLAIAAGLSRVLPALLPADFPRVDQIGLGWRVALMGLGASLIVGMVTGAFSAWQSRTRSIAAVLSEEGLAPIGMGARLGSAWARMLMMAAQVAIATVLLVGASLLLRSFLALMATDRGFEPRHVLTAELPLPDDARPWREVLDDLVARLTPVPGVQAVGYTNILPLTDSESMMAFVFPGRKRGPVEQPIRAAFRAVSAGYFRALGLRIVNGRPFDASDGATSHHVTIVNRAFATAYLDDTPLDERVPMGVDDQGWAVVGVVDTLRAADGAPDGPEVFVPAAQWADRPGGNPVIAIRTTDDPASLAPVLRSTVQEVDAGLALGSVMTMGDRLSEQLARPRLYTILLAVFGGLAIAMAGVGVFGVLTWSVAQRARELAVRSALGASPGRLLGLVLWQGVGVIAAGLVVGLTLALLAAPAIRTLLYGVTPADLPTYAGAAAVVGLIGVAACAVPAIGAASVDPVRHLRRG